MAGKYSRMFYIPLPENKIEDLEYVKQLDPVEDRDVIKSMTSILAYQVNGARIKQYQHSEFVLVEVLVHMLAVGFIRAR